VGSSPDADGTHGVDEPCAESAGEAAGKLALVELQQVCFGQGNGGHMSNSN
jgi:hypothetical protein